jgi:dihydroorotase
MAGAQRYDLLVKGGRVLDPSQGLDGVADVAIAAGRVAAVARDLPTSAAAEVLDARGLLVTPGLIDFHVHVYLGGVWNSVDPNAMPPSGVTTVVDAGSSGAGNFAGFRTYVIEPAVCRILAFLNISFAGIFGALGRVDVPEAGDVRLLNVGEAVAVAREHPEIIRGIKVRLGRHGSGALSLTALQMALEAAEMLGLPVLAHIDDPPPRVLDVLAHLRPGDVLTHAFRRAPNSLLGRDGTVDRIVAAARERGVLLETGHGYLMFSVRVARELIRLGVAPDIIGTDLYRVSSVRPDLTMPQVLSKCLALGMSLEQVVRAATETPARVLGLAGRLGTLAPGAEGDVTVLRVVERAVTHQGVPEAVIGADAAALAAERQSGTVQLEPVHTIIGGRRVAGAAAPSSVGGQG